MFSKKIQLLLLMSLTTHITGSLADQMIRNGSFSNGIDGWWTAGGNIKTTDKQACMEIVNPGENSWSVILGHGGIGLEQGESYQIRFDAYANTDTKVKTLIQHEGPPYAHHFVTDTDISTTKKSYHYTFLQEQASDVGAEFQFQMGAQKQANICISNMSIEGKPYIKVDKFSPIRLNQLGFLPNADKFVFVASQSKQPLKWTLQNNQGINVDLGQTSIFGINNASGEHLHRIDLSAMTTEQKGLTIQVGEDKSTPFDISSNIYNTLKYDAFSYFYQNRSGIDIEKSYVQRPDLARPAGHSKDIVTCYDKKDAWGNDWPGCDFSINVSKGWYDAGDHGKYTVNSGISTWTLLNLYERGKWLSGASLPLSEGKAKIPEMQGVNSNVNPILSEARWNIEFMLAMQIPEGKVVSVPLGDQSTSRALNLTKIDASHLAFHKVADEVWTGIPLPPHKDDKKRYVGQPSTAATLNLVAIGAQCARIWKDIDPQFSSQCLTASESAWQAAQKFPDIYAYDNFTGSGPYGDLSLTDEFYWASAELFITTGKDEYRDYIKKSAHYLETPTGNLTADGDIFWQYTAPLGTVSLAIVPNELSKNDQYFAKKAIVETATKYRQQMENEGYHIPYSAEQYPWGSNSNLVNRSIFLIYANDFTKDISFLKATANAMDYLLGANPMAISYVTGYGTRFAQNPHHRFWSKSADENSPSPAPGALIGGPNSISFSDPIAAPMKGKCIGQTCYRDNIGAWTLNEITINWNAPLVWVSSALDEGKLNENN
jgi:endoglucanase